MYRNKAETVNTFVDDVLRSTPQDKKSFVGLGGTNRADGLATGAEIILASDQVRHIHARHPDFSEWEKISDVVANGTTTPLAMNQVTGRESVALVQDEGKSSLVVVGSFVDAKEAKRFVVLTAFRDTSSAVQKWIATKKNAALYQSAGGSPAYPSPEQGAPSGSKDSVHRTLPSLKTPVKPVLRGAISFLDNGQSLITLFKNNADLSTFVHEAGHLFMKDMEAVVATGNAPRQVLDDLETLNAFTAEYAPQSEELQAFYDNEYTPYRKAFANRILADLTPEEVSQVRYAAGQEKLANAFLAYLREGNAPSPQLRNTFRRFKDWLVSIYESIYKSIMGNVQINDEVRAVFDRLLAADADIDLAQALHMQDMEHHAVIDAVAKTMLSNVEHKRLQALRKESTEESKERRIKKTMQAYAETLLGKKDIERTVRDQINAKPVYQAIDKAKQEGGITRASVEEAFGEETVRAMMKKQPTLIRKEGGVDVNDLAVVADYESAEVFVNEVLAAPGKTVEIREGTKRLFLEREQLLRKELGLDESKPGEEDYYNDSRLQALLLETRALERAASSAQRLTPSAAINQEWAQQILEAMPVRDALNVGKHAAAEAREAAKSAKALASGNMEVAANAKRKQAINHAMVLKSLKMRYEQQRFDRALKRWANSKTMVFAYQEQILTLAQRYGLGPKGRYAPQKPNERSPLGAFIEQAAAEHVLGEPPLDDFVLSETVPDSMTMQQMHEVRFAATWLAKQGLPGEAKLTVNGLSGSVQDAAKQGAAILKASGNTAPVFEEGTLKRNATDKWRAVFASLNEFKDQMMKADGYMEIGTKGSHKKGFHSLWHQRIMDAHNEMSHLYRKEIMPEQRRIEYIRDGFIIKFKKTFGKRVAAINGISPPENMREIGRASWTAEHIWCLARNMGNAGNLKTLTTGYGLSMEELHTLTATLNAEEWQAVQAEGNLLGTYYERTDEVFRRVYGRPIPDKVQPQALTVRTAEGTTLELPGWYFPISIDNKLVPNIRDKNEIDMVQGDPNFTAFGPSLAQGHTKGRTGTGKPSGLYFGVFERALSDQLRFMTHAPVIYDFDRIIRNPEWRKAYVNAFGQQAYDQLRPLLKYLARPVSERSCELEGFIVRQRQLATLYILGHNFKTFFRQFQGFFQAESELGAAWEFKGLARTMQNPLAMHRNIHELSPFMADRAKGFDREQREALNAYKATIKIRINGATYTDNDVNKFTMSLIQVGDMLTTDAIWQGAYLKAQEKLNMGTKEAVAFADSIIQKTQASATPVDLTPLQRHGGVWRLFTMFMSESLRKGSRMRYWWGALQAKKIVS